MIRSKYITFIKVKHIWNIQNTFNTIIGEKIGFNSSFIHLSSSLEKVDDYGPPFVSILRCPFNLFICLQFRPFNHIIHPFNLGVPLFFVPLYLPSSVYRCDSILDPLIKCPPNISFLFFISAINPPSLYEELHC